MISTIEVQFMSLIISVFAGLAGGGLFDLYRTINYYTRPSKAFLYFMDLLFWITTGGAVFVILLNAEFAELRAYTFAGMALGIFIYFKLFTEYILKFYRAAFYGVAKLLRLIVIIIILPFKVINSIMWAPLNTGKKYSFKAATCLKRWIVLKVKMLKKKK